MTTKQDALQAFFDAYETLQSLPKKKGAPDMERKAALELVEMRAKAVRACVVAPAAVADPALEDYRRLTQSVTLV